MFQSTHPHGVRLTDKHIHHSPKRFQSTHPHGVRPGGSGTLCGSGGFNPRTHTGCDFITIDAVFDIDVSIHAPTRGATLQPGGMITSIAFQSTHPHGVRHEWRHHHQTFYRCFNPRTHTGCDFTKLRTKPRITRFNPRTHTGCDQTK